MDQPSIKFLGAAGTVTGSKFLVSYNGTEILLDCGLFQGLKELRLRNWSPLPVKVQALRAVILTHAHIDHSGYLPKLIKLGFRGDVYATSATCDLLKILLPDSAYLQEEEARYANRRGYSKHRPALPLYTVEDAERALALLRPVSYADEIELAKGLSCHFSRVGHILGAAAIRIGFDTANGKRFLVDSGDLGRYGRPILKDPDPIEHADWLLVESTYGNRTHPTNSEDELAKVIKKVAVGMGCLIIPSFAVGRTQEIIYSIRALEDQGKIPPIPVHIDSPMAIDATDVYCAHSEEHDLDMKLLSDAKLCPLSSKKFYIHRTAEESKAINDLAGPLIIISASGMVTGGRVLHHLKRRLPDDKTTVLLVGFQAEGTRGRTLQSGKNEVKMLGEIIPVRAEVKTIDGFSAHADQDEILRWLRSFKKPPRRTFVTHGEPPASQALHTVLRDELKWNTEIPSIGQTVVLQ
ncbi:MAG TPA: MBL fold metallo-hydrolase [Candidatus Binatia bacterium]